MASIQFTDGFTIVPNSAGVGAGEYYLLIGASGYNPALSPGKITFPKHSVSLGIAEIDLILSEASLYINFTDANSVDRTAILTSMITNSGTIRLSQNTYHIEFSFTPGAFRIHQHLGVDTSVYWDNVPTAPSGTLSLVSSSGTTFNNSDPITISISI